MILVTGFGPFPGVDDNPAERLARQVHGRRTGGHTFLGCVLPVSFARAPRITLDLVQRLQPDLVLGVGVATSRGEAWLERKARKAFTFVVPDVDGQRIPAFSDHGPEVFATADVSDLAQRLQLGISDDAGTYVCNAWLYEVAGAASCPAAFLHVPPAGLEVECLLRAWG